MQPSHSSTLISVSAAQPYLIEIMLFFELIIDIKDEQWPFVDSRNLFFRYESISIILPTNQKFTVTFDTLSVPNMRNSHSKNLLVFISQFS